MSTLSSESGSDTALESQEHPASPINGNKRKSVIDTRRAEQNRAAQRAFRQRKEVYVKELENKVQDMEILKDRLSRLEIENERLKYRVWELESSPTSTSTSPSVSASVSASVAGATTTDSMPSPLSSYYKTRPYGNDTTSTSSDITPRQLQHNQWQPFSTDISSKTTKTTENNETSLPSSSASLSPPPQSLSHSTGSTTTMTHHILSPPSPSPSIFRPIPVAYWDKCTSSKRQQHTYNGFQQRRHNTSHQQLELQSNDETPAEHGQVLDNLASILRTHHRPPIHHHRPQNEEQSQQRQEQPEPELMHT
ncbi:hypothetical protein BCR42DRAFT_402430 [Absidia repens]|uniref:BZIP domain-containing protein n=1 Tax=Absidia repens TaxID=90262 RepID=A0A1X2IY26_9FUNG|nr:hypothetical protein BCR42DRAFT_402430 [Absidia repens]